MSKYLAYWSKRRTPQVVDADSNSQARSKAKSKKKSNYGTLESVKKADSKQAKKISKGKWVKGDHGRNRRGIGPKPKGK